MNASWRKVGGPNDAAYVLTDDRKGLGERHAVLFAWAQACDTLQGEWRRQVTDKLDKTNAKWQFKFAQDNPNTPSAALLQKLQAIRPGPGEERVIVRLDELPGPMRTAAQKTQDESRNDPVQSHTRPTDQASVAVKLWVKFWVPGVGWTGTSLDLPPRSAGALDTVSDTADPASCVLTPEMTTRAAIVPLPDEAALPSVLEQAQKAGFNEVWCLMPSLTAADRAHLASAAVAGKARDVKIRAVVRAFRADGPDDSPDADRNIRGETWRQVARRFASQPAARLPLPMGVAQQGNAPPNESQTHEAARQAALGEWVTPDADRTARRGAEIAALASVPDLAGIVVQDLIPSGYDFHRFAVAQYGSQVRDGGDLGYSDAARLRFLRETGVDPIDISVAADSFLGDGTTSFVPWDPAVALPDFPALPSALLSNLAPPAASDAPVTVEQVWGRWMRRRGEAGYGAAADLLRDVKNRIGALPLLATWATSLPSSAITAQTDPYLRIEPDIPRLKTPFPPTTAPLETVTDEHAPMPSFAEQRKRVHTDAPQVLSSLVWPVVPPGRGVSAFDLLGNEVSNQIEEALEYARTTHDGIVVDFSRLPLADALQAMRHWKVHPASASAPNAKP